MTLCCTFRFTLICRPLGIDVLLQHFQQHGMIFAFVDQPLHEVDKLALHA